MVGVQITSDCSVFAQNQVNYHRHYPKGITWHFNETKAIKHDYYGSLIM